MCRGFLRIPLLQIHGFSLSIKLPPEDAVYCPQMTMPPHPATDASELAKSELLEHGFHEKPAFVPVELGFL